MGDARGLGCHGRGMPHWGGPMWSEPSQHEWENPKQLVWRQAGACEMRSMGGLWRHLHNHARECPWEAMQCYVSILKLCCIFLVLILSSRYPDLPSASCHPLEPTECPFLWEPSQRLPSGLRCPLCVSKAWGTLDQSPKPCIAHQQAPCPPSQ